MNVVAKWSAIFLFFYKVFNRLVVLRLGKSGIIRESNQASGARKVRYA